MAKRLQKLVESRQAQISNLRAQTSSDRSTAAKDLSLISLIPMWSGTEKLVSVKEFFFFKLLVSSARTGIWNGADKIKATVLKLTEPAKASYSSNLVLHATDISWENFQTNFFFCIDSEMLEAANISLCKFKQSGNRKRKLNKNFWTVVVHWL